ncbi:hypothetical protein CMV_009604 [Castanea mollissima]|uniref:Nuclear pore complex protein Nup85 n=1 Tax=Castanea mollissima TaxID=60419 RepID=A0A8J4RCI9_9ROSI|nr:hypothetical protein CMV_009604 [Castanea mollissima]
MTTPPPPPPPQENTTAATTAATPPPLPQEILVPKTETKCWGDEEDDEPLEDTAIAGQSGRRTQPPIYLASCIKQGMGLLEILLRKQPVQNNQVLLKIIEICRLYELDSVSSNIMKAHIRSQLV